MSIVFYPMAFDKTITISTGGEESGYPKENIEDGNWNTIWMNDNDNETCVIDIDMGEDIQADFLAIGNHNLTDTDYGIKFSYDTGNDGNYGGLEYLIGSAGTYHDYVTTNENIWLETFTVLPVGKRYFRLDIENKNGVKPEIAIISIGSSYTININYSYGATLGKYLATEQRKTTGGQIKVNQLHDEKNIFQINFDDISETDKNSFNSIFTEIHGSLYPFFFSDIDSTIYYVRKEDDNNFNELIEYQLYNKSWTLIEEN